MYTIEEYDKEKTRILKYVIFKKRTEQEVIQKFQSEIEEFMLEDIIQELKDNSYINDEIYVERAINEFMAINTLSIKQIKYKLYSKGIKNDILEAYIKNNQEELEAYERKNVEKLVLKKKNSMEEEKLKNFLRGKGYKEEYIKDVMCGGE